jgi:hypothetical protein
MVEAARDGACEGTELKIVRARNHGATIHAAALDLVGS